VAKEVVATAVSALASALVCCTLITDPSLIVIGGGVARVGESLITPLRKAMETMLRWREPPDIVASQVSEGAGRLGAGLIAWEAVGAR
jgi:glucokinase